MRLLLLITGALEFGCDSAPKTEPAPTPKSEGKATVEHGAPAAASGPAELEPLAPAPEGTVEIGGRYVHTCAAQGSCPTLMQAPGAAHCASLTLGGLSWRLPTVDELESWRGHADLAGFDVFHWSGSAWQEDATQVWIYDPGSNAKTTASPTRKPFTIRCVAEPR